MITYGVTTSFASIKLYYDLPREDSIGFEYIDAYVTGFTPTRTLGSYYRIYFVGLTDGYTKTLRYASLEDNSLDVVNCKSGNFLTPSDKSMSTPKLLQFNTESTRHNSGMMSGYQLGNGKLTLGFMLVTYTSSSYSTVKSVEVSLVNQYSYNIDIENSEWQPTWTDNYPILTDSRIAGVNDDTTPLALYGNYILNYSIPTLNVSTDYVTGGDTDYIYSDRMNGCRLELWKGIEKLYSNDSYRTSSVNYRWAKELQMSNITSSGTYTWRLWMEDDNGVGFWTEDTFIVRELEYTSPQITLFNSVRCKQVLDSGGTVWEESDDGIKVWLDLSANISAIDEKNAWRISLSYGENVEGAEMTEVVVDSGTDGQLITWTKKTDTLIQETFDSTKSYVFTINIKDTLGLFTSSSFIYKAGSIFNIERTGVAVGKRSTGTVETPLFEVAYPAVFSENIAIPANALFKVVDITGSITGAANGNGTGIISTNFAETINEGYTPIGVVGVYSGTSYWTIYRANVVSTGVEISARRFETGTASTTLSPVAKVLFLRTSL